MSQHAATIPDGPSQAKQTRQKGFESFGQIVCSLAEMLRPPERLSISDAAERYVFLNNPGAYIGPFKTSMVWYMVEPMNELAARDKKGVVFVGSAQSSKTQSLILNWLGYTVTVDPMDMIIYSPTKGAARDFSMRRVDRMHRDSPKIGSRLLKQRDADNKFDKLYDSGIMLTLSHPSVTEFAGRPIPRVALTDYDRMDDDIGGDGSPFDLASKRTTTFGSFAMTLAESSPSKPITDPKYIPRTKHEAPPANGILGLYNRGDRRRRYWPCPDCGEYFEPNFKMMRWDTDAPNKTAAGESARLHCPHCDYPIHPDQRNECDMWGEWIKDGQWIDKNGVIHGEDPRTPIASFWLNGVIAAFISWKDLVVNFLTAEEEYARTGSEESLKKFYNNDLGEPYLPKSLDSERLPEVLKKRAEPLPVEDADDDEEMVQRFVQGERNAFRPMVPAGVRFLVATIDVQKNMFVVQVFGIMPGDPFDTVLIDRFNIVKSRRLDDSGEHLWVKPASYLDDWDRITEEVLDRSYPLADGSGRHMMIKLTGCDSGGKAGVTTNAYNYYRKLRAEGYAGRFHLVKGDSTPGAPRTRISYPDANRRDKFAAARGDVPVLMLNSNALKDALAGRLECVEPGKGYFRMADWLPDNVFTELCVEVRTTKGWENPTSSRNEAWDLAYYCIGLCASPLLLIEQLNWEKTPPWAAEWDLNSLVTAPDVKTRFVREEASNFDFAKLAANMA
jgi:phage terminase large subunit GpA-like protein